MLCNEVQPLALPLGELSPQVTERVVQSFLNDEINLYAHTTKIHLAWPLFPLSVFASLSHLSQRARQGMLVLGSIWKPSTRPNSGSFPSAVHHFPLQYTKYSCGKMASSDEKSLAVGHISGFQIDPNEPQRCDILYLVRRLKWFTRF